MKRFKRMLLKVFCPRPAVIIVSVPVAVALLAYTFLQELEYSPVAYVSYVFSAYALAIVCTYIVRMPKGGFHTALHRNPHVHRYLTDVAFKTHVSLYLSLGLNLLFAAIKLFYGICYRSVWFGTLAVYYILLAIMRFLLLRHVNRVAIGSDLVSELKRYRLCGIILMLMNSALSGVVILVVQKNEGFHYAGYLIYVVAMYAFYSVITAVMDLVEYRKFRSPVMSASKAIKLAAALVSMLSLETAMLMQFGSGKNPEAFRRIMTAATGGCVCLLVLIMAVFMIVRSTKQLHKLSGLRQQVSEESQ